MYLPLSSLFFSSQHHHPTQPAPDEEKKNREGTVYREQCLCKFSFCITVIKQRQYNGTTKRRIAHFLGQKPQQLLLLHSLSLGCKEQWHQVPPVLLLNFVSRPSGNVITYPDNNNNSEEDETRRRIIHVPAPAAAGCFCCGSSSLLLSLSVSCPCL